MSRIYLNPEYGVKYGVLTMHLFKKIILTITTILPVILSAQQVESSNAAKKFVASLNPNQQKIAIFSPRDTNRFNWFYVPLKNRMGISWNEMNAKQKKLSFLLLQSFLSGKAYQQSQDIIKLENILKKMEPHRESWVRDPGNYKFVFFGNPLKEKAYIWRFEGHHLSFTFSSINNTITSATPAFMGSNPGIILTGSDKGKEILKDESGLGFSLLHTLKSNQLSKALLSREVPSDILTGNQREVFIDQPQGISYLELDDIQKKKLIELISLYIYRNTRLFGNQMMKEITNDGLENIYFLWIGAQQKEIGKPHYYRIQGPGFIIEFDNSQNNANHVHTVFRDLRRDFGDDELGKHYREKH